MRRIVASCILVGFSAGTVLPAQAQHTAVWIESTPAGGEHRCLRVRNAEALARQLSLMGWPPDRLPKIDFKSNDAIIVSPTYSHATHRMTFIGLKRRDNRNYLSWGLQEIPNAPEINIQRPNGTWTRSSSSTAPGVRQTLVVAMDSGYIQAGFDCIRAP
jgi:hypothetical protein